MVFSMFTGCTEDDSMTEIQRPNQQPETVETDPVVKALAAILLLRAAYRSLSSRDRHLSTAGPA